MSTTPATTFDRIVSADELTILITTPRGLQYRAGTWHTAELFAQAHEAQAAGRAIALPEPRLDLERVLNLLAPLV